MTPPDELYTVRNHEQNIDLINRIIGVPTVKQAIPALRECVETFHPSLLSELDYRRIFGSLDAQSRQLIYYVGRDLFISTLPVNLRARHEQLALPMTDVEDVLNSYRDLFVNYWSTNFQQRTQDGVNCLALISALRTRSKGVVTSNHALQLTHRIRRTRDINRLPSVINTEVSNCLFASLDNPLTRFPAEAFQEAWEQRQGSNWPLLSAAAADTAADKIMKYALWLDTVCAIAEDCRLNPLTQLARGASEELRSLDATNFDQFDGIWTWNIGICGRCSMWSSAERLTVLDSSSSLLEAYGKDIIYLPAGLGQMTCPFCSVEVAADAPAIFYSDTRMQIIYCFPNWAGKASLDASQEYWRPLMMELRKQCREHLSPETQARFDAASELPVMGWDEFMYAIQMGDVVSENHLFNLVQLPDGTGLILDMTKGFIRHLTGREMDGLRTAPPAGIRIEWEESNNTADDWLRRQAVDSLEDGLSDAIDRCESMLRDHPDDPKMRVDLAFLKFVRRQYEEGAQAFLTNPAVS